MKSLILLFLSSVILFANVGKITAIKGEVYIDRHNKQILAKAGSPLQLKDIIKTKKRSKALILFNDKTSITVGKESTLTVQDYVFDLVNPKKSKATFGFGQGVFRTITGKIGKLNRDKFKIKTSTASIGIRGTNFIVRVAPDGMQIGVQDGGIFFVPKGSTQAINIDKGFKVTFDDKTKKFKTEPMKDDDPLQKDVEDKELKEKEKRDEKVRKDKAEKEDKAKKDKAAKEEKAKKDKAAKEDKAKEDKAKEDKAKKDKAAKEDKAKEDKAKEDKPKKEEAVKKEKPKEPIKQKADTKPQEQEETTPKQTQEETPANEPVEQEPQEETPAPTGETNNPPPQQEIAVVEQAKLEIPTEVVDTAAIQESVKNAETGALAAQEDADAALAAKEAAEAADALAAKEAADLAAQKAADALAAKEAAALALIEEVNNIPNIEDEIEQITNKLMNDSSDTYMNFGYTQTIENDILTNTNTYITGDITPSEIIESYISNSNSANYSGEVSSLVDGVSSGGTINLDMNFGTQNVTGDININQGNWQANINSGSLNPYGFNSDDISSGVNSDVQDITGNLDGKFYGPTADSVGGTFNLNSNTAGSVNGVFGGSK